MRSGRASPLKSPGSPRDLVRVAGERQLRAVLDEPERGGAQARLRDQPVDVVAREDRVESPGLGAGDVEREPAPALGEEAAEVVLLERELERALGLAPARRRSGGRSATRAEAISGAAVAVGVSVGLVAAVVAGVGGIAHVAAVVAGVAAVVGGPSSPLSSDALGDTLPRGVVSISSSTRVDSSGVAHGSPPPLLARSADPNAYGVRKRYGARFTLQESCKEA